MGWRIDSYTPGCEPPDDPEVVDAVFDHDRIAEALERVQQEQAEPGGGPPGHRCVS